MLVPIGCTAFGRTDFRMLCSLSAPTVNFHDPSTGAPVGLRTAWEQYYYAMQRNHARAPEAYPLGQELHIVPHHSSTPVSAVQRSTSRDARAELEERKAEGGRDVQRSFELSGVEIGSDAADRAGEVRKLQCLLSAKAEEASATGAKLQLVERELEALRQRGDAKKEQPGDTEVRELRYKLRIYADMLAERETDIMLARDCLDARPDLD